MSNFFKKKGVLPGTLTKIKKKEKNLMALAAKLHI